MWRTADSMTQILQETNKQTQQYIVLPKYEFYTLKFTFSLGVTAHSNTYFLCISGVNPTMSIDFFSRKNSYGSSMPSR